MWATERQPHRHRLAHQAITVTIQVVHIFVRLSPPPAVVEAFLRIPARPEVGAVILVVVALTDHVLRGRVERGRVRASLAAPGLPSWFSLLRRVTE
jgi:hypothetical protein